ncbi:MAG: FecCD family ABC transporter permease [Gulosibacter sp.]|uniref:FecCD family ABC transporter permease n=1 Tax=Gulosibacter sp. TaxID=2817531 RepID=UPI003F908E24
MTRTLPVTDTGASDTQIRKALRARHAQWNIAGFRFRFERRGAIVYLVLAAVAFAAAIAGILIGDYSVSLGQILASFTGTAEDPLAQYFVTQVRLPRAVNALFVGAALGISGAIFQTVSGNPLGSPDIIGFTTGAATGALLQIVLFNGGTLAVSIAAIVGGLITAAIVYGFSWRGGVAGFRLVLVGIGIGAVLSAVNSLLVVKAPLDAAQEASQWLVGSLNSTLWPEARAVGIGICLILPIVIWQHRALTQLALGDDIALGVGVRPERTRLVMIFAAVALMAIATAATGPIAFVALAAPHVVKKLTRTPGIAIFGAALMGGVLVLVSDLIARRIFAPNELAVGVITGLLGGFYLIWLLAVERKRL